MAVPADPRGIVTQIRDVGRSCLFQGSKPLIELSNQERQAVVNALIDAAKELFAVADQLERKLECGTAPTTMESVFAAPMINGNSDAGAFHVPPGRSRP